MKVITGQITYRRAVSKKLVGVLLPRVPSAEAQVSPLCVPPQVFYDVLADTNNSPVDAAGLATGAWVEVLLKAVS